MRVTTSTNRLGSEGPGFVFGQIIEALKEVGVLYNPICHNIMDVDELDAQSAKDIKECDVLICRLGSSLTQLKRAKSLGAKTLLANFSTHSLNQYHTLTQIYALMGKIPFSGKAMARAIREFDESDHHLVLSNFAKKTYIEHEVDADTVHVANLGIDSEKFYYSELDSDEFNVLFIGTNPIRKGLPFLYKAWAELNLDANLVVRSGAAFNPPKNVMHIKDNVDNLADLYALSSITCLPSLEDGFGATVLESMSCGRPVIITEAVGAIDVVKDGREGLIIPTCNPNAIKEAIMYFVDNPNEIKRMGKNARKTAEKYPWSVFRKRIVEIVESIAK